MPGIGRGQCWLSVKSKIRDCWIVHRSSLTQCLVLSCHRFLYQFKLISWGGRIPPWCLVVEAHDKGLRLGGGGIRAGQQRELNNVQVAWAPEQRHRKTQNNELGQSAGRSSSPDCPLTSVATGWSGPYSPPERHFPAQTFLNAAGSKKNFYYHPNNSQ